LLSSYHISKWWGRIREYLVKMPLVSPWLGEVE
jgi:hypothetical protein